MSASISSAKSKRGKLVPLPKEKIDAINEVYEAQRKLKMEPVNESILFQSQEAKDGFQQAEVELKEGTLYEDFTKATAKEEYDKRIRKEQEEQEKYKNSLDKDVQIWRERMLRKQQEPKKNRTTAQFYANMTSRANHDRVVNGLSNRADDHMRVAEITHKYMTDQHRR
jgi:hypothetical protein